MPAIYAHNRFGAMVSGRLEGELKDTVRNHYTQFRIGLQGPDIFFFYKPYCSNRVAKYGIHLHGISAYPFFEHAVSIVREKGRSSREYAYLMGFICHYILDSECHPYVSEMMEKTDVGHMEIEEEFEKKLLRLDKKDPFRYHLDRLVPTDDLTAEVISPFYPGINSETVKESLKTLKFVKKLFRTPRACKRWFFNAVMKVCGKYKEYNGLVHQKKDNPKCRESNEGLQKRFENAISIAVCMIESFDETVRTGKELEKRFDRTFE